MLLLISMSPYYLGCYIAIIYCSNITVIFQYYLLMYNISIIFL